MSEREYKYNAFISYRHREPDRAIAIRLQEMLETYAPPKEIVKQGGVEKLHLFRDEDELPMSANLSANIEEALRSSRFLICICSPSYPESRWCMREIEQFKEMHDGATGNIMTLVVEGEAPAVFPQQLLSETRYFTDAGGAQHAQEVPVEPLAGNVAAPTIKESLKKLKREALRIAAPLLNVGFNDLYDRDARRRTRRVWAVSAAVAAASLLFAAYSGAMVARIRAQNRALREASVELLNRDARFSLDAGDPAAAARSTLEALDLQEALHGRADPETERTLARAASLYQSGQAGPSGGAPLTRIRKTFSANLYGCRYSTDGRSLVLWDYLDGLSVLDAATGRARFRRMGQAPYYVHAFGDAVYCADFRTLSALNPKDGRDLWRYQCAGKFATIAGVFFGDGRRGKTDTVALVLHGGEKHHGEAVFLDRATGKERGVCEIPWPSSRGDGGDALYAMDGEGRLWFALPTAGAKEGSAAWRVGCAAWDMEEGTPRYADVTLAHPARAILCDGETLYVNAVGAPSAASSGGTLYALDAASLRMRFQRDYPCEGMAQDGTGGRSLLLMAGERLLATARNGVHLFDRAAGEKIASWTLDAEISGAFDTGEGGVALYGPGGGYFLPDGAGQDFALGSERFVTFPGNALAVAMHDAGRFAVIRGEERNAVHLYAGLPSQNLRPVYGEERAYQRQPAAGGIGNYGFRVTASLSPSKGRIVFPVATKGPEGDVLSVHALDAAGTCRRLFDYALRGPFEQIDFLRVAQDPSSEDRILAMGSAAEGDLFLLFDEGGAELDRLTLEHSPNTPNAFLWDVDGSDYFATSLGVVWTEDGKLRAHRPEGCRYTAFDKAKDGAWAAAIADDRGGVSVVHGNAGDFENAVPCVDPGTGSPWRREGGTPVSCLAMSPAGGRLAFYVPDEGRVRLYDAGARSMRDIPLGASEGVAQMIFPDEGTLLILMRDGRLFACGAEKPGQETRLVAELFTRTDGVDSYMEAFRDGVAMVQMSGNGWAVDYRNGQVLAEIPHYLCGFGELGKIVAFTELNGGIRNSDYTKHGYRLYLGDYLDAAALKERGRAFLAAFAKE